MHLEIITPEKKVFEGEVNVITFPGVDGSFQLLNHHAPLMGLLTKGIVEYKTNKYTERIKITGGIMETTNNKTILLADGLEEL